jgi:tellurite resistance protein TerC
MWILFAVVVVIALVLDLGLFQKRPHAMKFKEALLYSIGWVLLAALFNLAILKTKGSQPAIEFLSGYLIELALSVDNLFVFIMLFSYFKVKEAYQHRVLFWGIVGAVVFRAVFILAGLSLIHRFEWLLYVLGALLIFLGIRMIFKKDEDIHPESNPIIKWTRKVIPVSKADPQGHFFVRHNSKRMATPLLIVLIAVETTDVIFAIDSIPAVLAVTLDPFIVFTSNIFAILGLRSFYFLLSRLLPYFHFLHYGVSAILVFIGSKMLLTQIYGIKIHVALTLGIMSALVGFSVLLSVLFPRKKEEQRS